MQITAAVMQAIADGRARPRAPCTCTPPRMPHVYGMCMACTQAIAEGRVRRQKPNLFPPSPVGFLRTAYREWKQARARACSTVRPLHVLCASPHVRGAHGGVCREGTQEVAAGVHGRCWLDNVLCGEHSFVQHVRDQLGRFHEQRGKHEKMFGKSGGGLLTGIDARARATHARAERSPEQQPACAPRACRPRSALRRG